MDYLAVYLIYKCFNIFLLFYWFQLDSIMVIDCNPNNFISLKAVEVCFMVQNMACFIWKKCVFCCYWRRVTCTWIRSCWLMVLIQFSYILAGFKSGGREDRGCRPRSRADPSPEGHSDARMISHLKCLTHSWESRHENIKLIANWPKISLKSEDSYLKVAIFF